MSDRAEIVNAVSNDKAFQLGGCLLTGLVRRVRRTADLSQRQLALAAGVHPSTVARIESGDLIPSLGVMQRVLNAATYHLVVTDVQGRVVTPLEVWDEVCDLAGRRFPAHLDTTLDPVYGEWWADVYGLTSPPETFRRNRAYRDWQRRRSRWEVRVSKLRFEPPPQRPFGGRSGDEWPGDRDSGDATTA